jgi:opacity protein-like surface antigen
MRVADAAVAAVTTLIVALAPVWQARAQDPDPPPDIAPPPEAAPTPTSFYLLAGGGASLPSDTDISGGGVATQVDTKLGYGALAAFGVDFGDNVRTEFEFAYRRAGIDQVGTGTTGSGDIGAYSAIGNVIFDFSNTSAVTPYAGLGLGAARIDYDDVSPVGGSRINDGDTVLALQGIAGLALELSPSIAMFTDYRYMAAGNPANNLIISRRRAEAVKKELMRQGVPEDWIEIAWKGETAPLIETPDGQRHQENRRVDIVITGKGIDGENAPSTERMSRK